MTRSSRSKGSDLPQGISVIIVNFNGGALLGQCLKALLEQTYQPKKIIIVDNASTDDSLAALPLLPSYLDVIRLPRNLGFAAANNLAVSQLTDTEWFALLNPDAIPEPEWLETLSLAARDYPQFCSFASRQICALNQELLDGAGDVYHLLGLAWRRGYGQKAAGRYEEAEEVFSACAAAALHRRDVFLAAGGFDETFFCYMEDVDLGFRLRLMGHRCLYVPQAVVRHVGSSSTGKESDFSIYHGHRNMVWTYLKNMPFAILCLTLPVFMLGNLYILMRNRNTAPRRFHVIWRAKRDALYGVIEVWANRRQVQRMRCANLISLLKSFSYVIARQ